MMLKQAIVAVAIVAMGLVSAQDNPTAPSACAASCVSGVFSNAASVGCANGDTLCVCGKTESLQDGIRDCIDAACPNDVPGVQIPLAIAYGNQICAQEAASISSTESLPTLSPSTAAAASTTVPASTSTTAPVPSVEPTSQSTISSTEVANTATSSSEVNNQATAAPVSLSTASESSTATETSAASETSTASESLATSESSSPTTSNASQATATSGATTASSGTSTAVKAGIGAGVGAASLAAIIIAVCVLVRRRQRKKTANRVRKYKISEPMSGSGRQFGDDIGRAESGLPTPIITTRPAYADSPGLATSPTSLYSNSSELETNARRYEDMQPRTQPRTMI
ncbi:hypothetical protein GGS24DRAFT_25015 [Hypoxylon argillaceum]|nr:hypothetical protein GGS24DRAFT_25015 [Hypoxylon argillaceum]